jgi:hypothetical protein
MIEGDSGDRRGRETERLAASPEIFAWRAKCVWRGVESAGRATARMDQGDLSPPTVADANAAEREG